MEISAKDKGLRAVLADEGEAQRRFGAAMGKKIALRIAALRAADSLADFWPPKSGPERCHELKGNMAGIFSVDVKQPYRLLFRPDRTEPSKDRSDEQKRWSTIKSIELLSIEDTHG